MTEERRAATKRLDLAPASVQAAKRAYVRRARVAGVDPDNAADLERVFFRDVLDFAAREFAPRLQRELLKIGLVRREVQARQRPVSIATWGGILEEMARRYDLSKIQILRCLLEMLAASEGLQAPLPTDEE
jgi:hypothetical protein